LTIGIPTLNRAEFLHRAIDSCLSQTVPVRIIVADQGHTKEVDEVMRRYRDHPHICHLPTSAGCLWENWEMAARACDTPYFAWLQDDDIIARGYAAHVTGCFQIFPDALHWQARIYCAVDERTAAWWGCSGPWVPLRILDNKPMKWPGQILVPSAYLTSWAMSPAVAFRCGAEFTKALDYMPADADLLAERIILATMGRQGPWVADPVVAGYWVHHGENESYKQHHDQDRQMQVMIEHLDELMDHTDWRDCFEQWCLFLNPAQIMGWLGGFVCNSSRYADQIKEVMGRSLQGRVEMCPPPAHAGENSHGAALGNGRATADAGELVWR